jgi:hypothetical protein
VTLHLHFASLRVLRSGLVERIQERWSDVVERNAVPTESTDASNSAIYAASRCVLGATQLHAPQNNPYKPKKWCGRRAYDMGMERAVLPGHVRRAARVH